jgi:hypothetical protein
MTTKERSIFDKRGLPKTTQRVFDLVDANSQARATRAFNPCSAGSRILAEQRLREDAQRLEAESDELGRGVADGVTIRFADLTGLC